MLGYALPAATTGEAGVAPLKCLCRTVSHFGLMEKRLHAILVAARKVRL